MQKILTGGYYLVSLDKVDLASEDSISLPHVAKLLYDSLKYKFVVFTEIVIDGVERNAIPCEFNASLTYTEQPEDWNEEEDGEFVPQPLYTANIVNLYGLDLAIDAEGGVTVTEHSDGGLDPTDIPEGDILQNTVLGLDEDGKVVKGNLFGKYVKVIPAPSSSTLTETELSNIIGGAIIEGDFLGLHNPFILPAVDAVSYWSGVMMGPVPDDPYRRSHIKTYRINKETRLMEDRGTKISFVTSGGGYTNISPCNIDIVSMTLKEKSFPSYPANQTNKSYHFVLNNGTLEWHEGNGLYLHTVTFTVSGTSDTMELRFISDSDQMFTHDPQANNFVNTGATFINLANQHNFVITPFGANGLNSVVYGFNTSTGAFTDVITFSGIITETITPIK